MTDLEQEAAWRTEFEADGERAVLDTICHGPGIYPDLPRRSLACAVRVMMGDEREPFDPRD